MAVQGTCRKSQFCHGVFLSVQWTVVCAERKAPHSKGTLFRAAIGRASGRVTAIRALQAQHSHFNHNNNEVKDEKEIYFD